MSSNYDLEAFAAKMEHRLLDLDGRIRTLDYRVKTLQLQMQRVAEHLNIELPYSPDDPESEHERRG